MMAHHLCLPDPGLLWMVGLTALFADLAAGKLWGDRNRRIRIMRRRYPPG